MGAIQFNILHGKYLYFGPMVTDFLVENLAWHQTEAMMTRILSPFIGHYASVR